MRDGKELELGAKFATKDLAVEEIETLWRSNLIEFIEPSAPAVCP